MDDLFSKYPLDSDRVLSNGIRVPFPYHITDGRILFIGGTADLAAAKTALQSESLVPLVNAAGRALMGLWLCDFTQASLGPHRELQFSLFVTRQPEPPIPAQTFSLLDALLFHPSIRMFCWRLWNDAENVVLYNRELLGLDARLAAADFTHAPEKQQTAFNFTDSEQGTILEGHIRADQRQPLGDALRMVQQLGFRKLMQMNAIDWVSVKVINPISDAFAFNGEAQTYAAGERIIVRQYDPGVDRLVFGQPSDQRLNFRPDFVYQVSGCKFIYLNVTDPANRNS
ncbi:MAG: hypothetical protein JNM70_05230 [Anaerolineae bacterium]|nr:hypothetical protein [Anaerolineae bacterium]